MNIQDLRCRLMQYPNVIGHSNVSQPKIKNGCYTLTQSIRVYVVVKESKFSLRIHNKEIIPKEINGIPTDVVPIGMPYSLGKFPLSGAYEEMGRIAKQRPVFAGISTGHPKITAGTLGQALLDSSDKNAKGHGSNWHIFKGKAGVIGDQILQPGTYDSGTLTDAFARLVYAEDVIPNDTGIVNQIDFAWSKIITELEWSADIARHTVQEKFQSPGLANCIVNQGVFFTGRTVAYGEGINTDISAYLQVGYGDEIGGSGIANYQDVLIDSLNPNIQPGNSGTPRYELGTDKWTGLYFAGSSGYIPTAIACKQENILFEYPQLKMPGAIQPPPPPPDWTKVFEDIDTQLWKKPVVTPPPVGTKVFEDALDVLYRK